MILYNIFLFSLFDPDAPKFWPAYLFTTLALIMGMGVIEFCVSNKNLTPRDTFLNWPMVYVSCGYAPIQVILSFAVLSVEDVSPLAANLTQAVPLAIYVILAVSAIFGRNIVDEIDKKQASQTPFIKNFTSEVERLCNRAKKPHVRNKLTSLYEAARYSDPVSHESLAGIEREIEEKFGELKSFAATDRDAESLSEEIGILCDEITELLDDRNGKCKFLK
jgi:hypothetical protein